MPYAHEYLIFLRKAISKSEFWQAIQSLARRGLLEKVQVGAGALFLLNPVFQQYIQSKSNPSSIKL
ncbi:hypothetical protein [Microcoleus sp. K4-C2]|uniref:hypothetical protein n=1 Tax=Microcoleus sp. K4-C2 TaxID=2818792 RepID=UPI002FCE7931